MISRLEMFYRFQFLAFCALIWPETTQRAFRRTVLSGIPPRPTNEVMRAAFKLKLHGEEKTANELLRSVVH